MRIVLALLTSLAATSAAGDFSLTFPLDCTLGDTCFIQQFTDQDPSSGIRDFACGTLAYDGHGGTDFALRNLKDQAAGVDVLAAASGTVVGTRDTMIDVLQTDPDAPDVSDRKCGNGVTLAHEDGFETAYCHMAQGSLTVTLGQTVTAGDVLGQVGYSGEAEFPHLHLSVYKDGQMIDPFDTNGTATCPDTDQPSLWNPALPTPAGGIIMTGVSQSVPTDDAIMAGTANTGAVANGPALVGWVTLFGIQSGDVLTTLITGPDGEFLAHSETLERTQARVMRAGGRRTPASGWPKGDYVFEYTLRRGDTVIDSASQTFTLN